MYKLILFLLGLIIEIISLVQEDLFLFKIGFFISVIFLFLILYNKEYNLKKYLILSLFIFQNYLIYLFLCTKGYFFTADSWKFLGTINNVISYGHIDFGALSFLYPTKGMQMFYSLLTILVRIEITPIYYQLITLFLAIIPLFLLIVLLKDFDENLRFISIFLFGIGINGFYLGYALNFVPHALAFILVCFILVFVYKYFNLYSVKFIFLHTFFFSLLLFIHLWASLLYLGFLGIYLLIKKQDLKKSFFFFIIPNFIFLFYLRFNPWYDILIIRTNFWLFLFLDLIFIFILFGIIWKWNFKRIIQLSDKIIKEDSKSVFVFFIAFLILTLFVYALNIYPTNKTYFEVIFAHFILFVSIFLIILGIYLLNKNHFENNLLIVIFSWVSINLIFFISSFFLNYFNLILVDPWRHIAYISFLGTIPLSYVLWKKTKGTLILVILFIALFAFSFISSEESFIYNYDSLEISSTKWIADNTPEYTTIAADYRMRGPITFYNSLNNEIVYNSDYIFSQPINSKQFNFALNEQNNNNLLGTNYIYWTNNYLTEITFEEINVNNGKLVNNYEIFDEFYKKVYNNGEVYIYLVQ